MTLPVATTKPGERTMNCGECGMLLPAERPVFHPHVYCLLIKAGVSDPEAYMRATMPLLVEHFDPPTERARCAGRAATAHPPTWIVDGRCPVCGEVDGPTCQVVIGEQRGEPVTCGAIAAVHGDALGMVRGHAFDPAPSGDLRT